MKLIAVISHKGGAGKTTTSVQLAEELARRGQRTLLVDADRQQGAGLLLGIESPAGCVQRTFVPQLEYLGSARLTDLEVADCYASVAQRFDVGVVDTPSLDDPLARAWLSEAAAALMVLQVDPLTIKTLPSALNTLEVVRAFKPTIQVLGLLPTMFNQEEGNHRMLLAELLSKRPEAVFTPVVPADPGLMHRANVEGRPPIAKAALQAYQCAVDRILRTLSTADKSAGSPRAAARPRPLWSQQPAGHPGAPAAAPQPAGGRQQPMAAPAGPPPGVTPAVPPWRDGGQATAPRQEPVPAQLSPVAAPAARAAVGSAGEPDARSPGGWRDESDAALETLAGSGERWSDGGGRRGMEAFPAHGFDQLADSRDMAGQFEDAPPAAHSAPGSANTHAGSHQDLDWWRRQAARVDSGGVVRRSEPWLVRARFAIACTVACLALIAAVVMGTLKRVPNSDRSEPNRGLPTAHAEAPATSTRSKPSGDEASKRFKSEHAAPKGQKKPHSPTSRAPGAQKTS